MTATVSPTPAVGTSGEHSGAYRVRALWAPRSTPRSSWGPQSRRVHGKAAALTEEAINAVA